MHLFERSFRKVCILKLRLTRFVASGLLVLLMRFVRIIYYTLNGLPLSMFALKSLWWIAIHPILEVSRVYHVYTCFSSTIREHRGPCLVFLHWKACILVHGSSFMFHIVGQLQLDGLLYLNILYIYFILTPTLFCRLKCEWRSPFIWDMDFHLWFFSFQSSYCLMTPPTDFELCLQSKLQNQVGFSWTEKHDFQKPISYQQRSFGFGEICSRS